MVNQGKNHNIQVVLSILKHEVDGAVVAAFDRMADDYSMTWMCKRGSKVLPSTDKNVTGEMKEMYSVKGKKYDIRNIFEKDDFVIVEYIESFPDLETGQICRSPHIVVFEVKNGKVRTCRHYCDPELSFEHISEEQLLLGFKGTNSKFIID